MEVVEMYYLCYTMMANPHFKMEMLLNDLKTLSKREFVVKWSNGLQVCIIDDYIFEREHFEDDFPEIYEQLPKLDD